jgi:hypothetical protein
VSAFGNLSHANLRRTTALGGADRGDIDPDDSEVVVNYIVAIYLIVTGILGLVRM